jgi:hypothetical protein
LSRFGGSSSLLSNAMTLERFGGSMGVEVVEGGCCGGAGGGWRCSSRFGGVLLKKDRFPSDEKGVGPREP